MGIEERKLAADEMILGMPQSEFAALARSCQIVIPHRASQGLRGEMAACFPQWALWETHVVPLEDQHGGFVELTRAGICREFIASCQDRPELDKLIMCDGDQTLSWDAPYRLAMWDLPIVSGVVCNYHSRRGVWACFTVKDQYGVPRFPSSKYSKLPTRGLLKAHSFGAGLICIKKSTIEAMHAAGMAPFEIPEATRKHALVTGVLKTSEDTSFCHQCESLGIDRYVDLSVQAVHWKTVPLSWPMGSYDQDAKAEDFKIDIREYHHGF